MPSRNIVHIEFPTRDAAESGKFYEALFGWKISTDPQMNYTQWEADAPPHGGFNPIGELAGVGEVLAYVASTDIDADLVKIKSLGGEVVVPKSEIPQMGWFAVFKDPTGNKLGLYTAVNRM